MKPIVPHLWFDKEAGEAATLYTQLFKHSTIKSRSLIADTPSGTAEIVNLELAGQPFMFLSAGPMFQLNPSVSFLVNCDSKEEVNRYWEAMSQGGQALMPLAEYPFSDWYVWVIDRFGVSWQLMLVKEIAPVQKIIPTLMFVGNQCGRAEEAVKLYTSLIEGSSIDHILYYGEGAEPNLPNMAKHIGFTMNGQSFAAMDSAYNHGFSFTEAHSLIVTCDTQAQIDHYWEALSSVPEAEACGWLKDPYGFSWQIVPDQLNQLMSSGSPEQRQRVTQAFMKMKKFDIEALIAAAQIE